MRHCYRRKMRKHRHRLLKALHAYIQYSNQFEAHVAEFDNLAPKLAKPLLHRPAKESNSNPRALFYLQVRLNPIETHPFLGDGRNHYGIVENSRILKT